MTHKDIGYFLHRLEGLYSYNVFSYESWLCQRVVITSTHGKKMDMPNYYKKYIREYKDVYDAPPHIEEIDKLFNQIGIS
ncbi:hypothetical protein EAX61_09225 [Dokdonia sinensis]|uniref:Uncharacterized protein n=1 Tax=Dokdonia sinensis TaxID=2479847 RepID=A0A3M0GBQ0_9FLAO|nr:hypothetical protein [Dokdonia sinensis]RMB58479.1 hypothetical protein EAX61_09225 [Dokdonia sinensis]